MNTQMKKYTVLPTVYPSLSSGYVQAIASTMANTIQNAGPRPTVCGPSRRWKRARKPFTASDPSGAFAQQEAGDTLRKDPDDDNHRNQEADLAEQLPLPGCHRRLHHREHATGRRRAEEHV